MVRLRSNLWIRHNEKKFQSGQILEKYPDGIEDARLGNSSIKVSIFTVNDRYADEDWIIAMNGKPTKEKALLYGKRWGIEAMFSDLKTRGFNIEGTKLKYPDRVERLMMCAAIALDFCIVLANTLEPY